MKATIRPTTYSSYEMHVRCYLVPAFGPLRLLELTAPTINAFYGELLQGWNGRPALSPATVRRIHATLHRALRDAVRWELIVRNQAGAADPPRARRPEITVWSVPQLHVFLRDAAADPRYALWLFYILTGVRRGEAVALRWSDLDLEAATATIRRSLVPVDHRLVFSEPKTERGRRLIGLDPRLVSVLGQRRSDRLLDDEALVFARSDGMPLHPSGSPGGSPNWWPPPAHPISACTTCVTCMRPWPPAWLPGFWPTAWDTARRRSPPTPTSTSSPPWTATGVPSGRARF